MGAIGPHDVPTHGHARKASRKGLHDAGFHATMPTSVAMEGTLDPSGLLQLRTSGADNRSSWTFRQSSKRPSAGAAFTVRNVPGKGMGMFAARDIEPGERIIAEKPLARWAVRTSATREERIRSFAEVVVDFSAEQKKCLACGGKPLRKIPESAR